jgi:8-oxo-dGTP diphosphatase
LFRGDRFLLQLRDDIPGILYPGYWAFFGGHLEAGEDPEMALRRELIEEIEYSAQALTLFGSYPEGGVQRYVFAGPLVVPTSQLVLHEGWDLGLLDEAAIRRGCEYSERAQSERPLGSIHQKILLEFIESQG